MPFLLEYLLKFSISLGILYVFYQFVLRPLTFYQWNRFYLACYTLLSFVIPFVNITPWINEGDINNNRLLDAIPLLDNSRLLLASQQNSWWIFVVQEKWTLVLGVFAAGSLFMLMKTVYHYFSLQLIKRKAVLIEHSSVNLYDVNSNISPFSFANSIYINTKMHTREELQKIIQHEFVHVKQKHTIDILIGEILIVVNWFNPFAWLVRKAIRQNLEFIADDWVLQTGLDARQYQYLLLKVVGIPQYSITNNFNFSSLKKRIIMMNKIKTTRVHLIKFLFVVPLLGLLLVAFREKSEIAGLPEITNVSPLLFKGLIDDTVPKPPLPPQPSLANPVKPTAPAQPPVPKTPARLPAHVSSITITDSDAMVKLKNGSKETYDLSKPEEKASFEKKYGTLVAPPAPPALPEPEVEPVPAVGAVTTTIRTNQVLPLSVKSYLRDAGPLVILDGEALPDGSDINALEGETIESINVIKGPEATSLYGKKAINGVLLITSKPEFVRARSTKPPVISVKPSVVKIDKDDKFNGLIIIDGKESTKEALSKIDPSNISEVNVLKGASAIAQYKEKGNNGVMIITTK